MTRRPLQPRMSRLVRTTHAQTPSAKKASESPTAKMGVIRPPRQAASTDPCVEFVTTIKANAWFGVPTGCGSCVEPVPVGGGAQDTLGDGSDATYIPNSGYRYHNITARFPPVTLPPGRITIDISVRQRAINTDLMRWFMVYLQGEFDPPTPPSIAPEDWDYWTWDDFGVANLTSDWSTLTKSYVDGPPRDYETSLGLPNFRTWLETGKAMVMFSTHALDSNPMYEEPPIDESLSPVVYVSEISLTIHVEPCVLLSSWSTTQTEHSRFVPYNEMDLSGTAIATDASVGDVVIAFCSGIQTGWIGPAGWVELGSGTIGVLDWWAGYLVVADLPESDPGYPSASPDDWTWLLPDVNTSTWVDTGSTGHARIQLEQWTDVTGTPELIFAEGTGTSLAFPSSTGLSQAGPFFASAAVSVATHTVTVDTDIVFVGNTYDVSSRNMRSGMGDDWTGYGSGWIHGDSFAGTVDTSTACNIVTAAIGWVV